MYPRGSSSATNASRRGVRKIASDDCTGITGHRDRNNDLDGEWIARHEPAPKELIISCHLDKEAHQTGQRECLSVCLSVCAIPVHSHTHTDRETKRINCVSHPGPALPRVSRSQSQLSRIAFALKFHISPPKTHAQPIIRGWGSPHHFVTPPFAITRPPGQKAQPRQE